MVVGRFILFNNILGGNMERKNKNLSLQKFDTEVQLLRQSLIELLMDFGRNTLDLCPVDHPKYIIRNSILYRLQSIRFHVLLEMEIYKKIIQKFRDNFFNNQTDEHYLLLDGTDQMLYIFDDIVFNSVSLLDYMGNIIGLLYQNKMNLKWNSICKSAYDKNNSLSKTEIAPIIIKHNCEWINHLYEYRSSLIHNRKDEAASNRTMKLERNENDDFDISFHFKVKAPYLFGKNIKILAQDLNTTEPSIIDVSLWLAEKVVSSSNELILCAKREQEPIINKKMELIYKKFLEEKGI